MDEDRQSPRDRHARTSGARHRRAMGFDNGYTLPYGSRRDRIKLVGNDVCQPVMAAVVRALTQEIGLLDAAERVASPPLATPRRHRRQLCV